MNYLHESDMIKRIRANIAADVERGDRIADIFVMAGAVVALLVLLAVSVWK